MESFTCDSVEGKGDDHFTVLNRKINFCSFTIPALFGINFIAIQVQSCLKLNVITQGIDPKYENYLGLTYVHGSVINSFAIWKNKV